MKMLQYNILVILILLISKSCNSQINTWTFSDRVIQYFMGLHAPFSICEIQINEYLRALNNKEKWAATMIDSTTKLQSGLFSGNLIDFGQFDQCLAIKQNSDISGTIRGKHCMVYAITQNFEKSEHRLYGGIESGLEKSEIVLGFGICLPASCSGIQVRNHMQKVVQQMNTSIANYDPEIVCNTSEKVPIDSLDAFTIFIFGITLTIIILSTSYDFMIRKTREGVDDLNNIELPYQSKWLLVFSLRQNFKRLFSYNRNQQEIKCLHGIRVLCLSWVMIGHRYMLTSMFPMDNSLEIDTWIASPINAIILSAQYSVDTFLVISGMLACRSYFKNIDEKYFSISTRYVHRYIRLTAPLIPVVLLGASTRNLGLGSGPNWSPVAYRETQNCRNYWWSTLLHIQNYVNPDSICIGQTWYLSLDAQLFFISPLIFASLKRWPRKSLIGIVLIAVGSISHVLLVSHFEEFPASTLPSNPQRQMEVYLPTHARAAPWFLGVILGFLIHLNETDQKRLCKHVVGIFWILAIVTVPLIIMSTWFLQQEQNQIWSVLHLGLSRPAWATITCWIVYACHFGKAGVLSRFLSHNLWVIVSRVSFCMYLLHLQIQLTFIASMRTPQHFTNYATIHSFCGDFVITFLLAFVWTLVFESPIMNIEKMYIQSKVKNRKAVEQISSTENGVIKTISNILI